MRSRSVAAAVFVLCFSFSAGWGDPLVIHPDAPQPSGRFFLRKVRFEPNSKFKLPKIAPGTKVDQQSAEQVAKSVQQELQADGYKDAKVQAKLEPAGVHEADLVLQWDSGERYKIEEVQFTGDLGLPVKELKGALRATRIRRIIPGLWKSHPAYSDPNVEADLKRLRSLYLSHGYFDARAELGNVEYAKDKVTLTFAVDSGEQYGVRNVKVTDAGKSVQIPLDAGTNFPSRGLCRCLLDAQRNAWKEGKIDFSARLETQPAEGPGKGGTGSAPENWVNITTKVDEGQRYRVGRIEFRGNSSLGDSTLRRALVLDEGDPFDPAKLFRSMKRLNGMGLFEPITPANVVIQRNASSLSADVTISLSRKTHGRWYLSGPVGPFSVGGPLQGIVQSRLPDWGPGFLQASTYYATLSLTAFYQPVFKLMSWQRSSFLFPFFGIERPYLAGQEWQSGFLLSPQFSLKQMAALYGINQVKYRVRTALQGNGPAVAGLAIPVEHSSSFTDSSKQRILICEPTKSRWSWLGTAASLGIEWFLTVGPL